MTDPMTTAAAGPDGAVLEARALFREFRQGPATLPVLTGVELRIGAGERIAIVGSSGSGKTTLLQILGGLDRPTSGCVEIAGRDIHALDETARGALRNRTIGFVYQFHHLLPEFTALENVAMPLLVRRMPTREARAAAAAILVRVGLGERLDQAGGTLSGGEQQMLAIGRALVGRPKLLLLDEPSLGLAPLIVAKVFDVIGSLATRGITVMIVEQNARAALKLATRGYVLETGRVTLSGTGSDLAADRRVRDAYLGEG